MALAAWLMTNAATAALTASLESPGAPLREHDPFSLILTLSNTGAASVTNLAAVLRFSEPLGVTIESSPVIGSATALPAHDALRITWSLRAVRAGLETITVDATGFSLGANLAAEASRAEVIAPKAAAAMAYPNPVSGDALTLVLNLGEDAEQVTAEVFNASFHRVADSVWRDVPHADGRVMLSGVSGWAPGIYAIRIKTRSAGGGERTFPLVKVQVKR